MVHCTCVLPGFCQWLFLISEMKIAMFTIAPVSGLVSSVRRALASKLRGPGFKSQPGTVGGPARLEISFELNLLPRVNKVTLLYIAYVGFTHVLHM